VTEQADNPEFALRNPVLVVAFTGWGDAAGAASSATLLALRQRSLMRIAEFGAERFYVLTNARPLVKQHHGQRLIQWPSLTLLAGRAKASTPSPDASGDEPRDVVALVAAEPALRWPTFATLVADRWVELGGGLAILLGSFLADTLHVGPVPLVGAGSTPRLGLLLRSVGVARSNYEGPVSMLTPLYEALAQRGVPCVNVWAAVPQYLASVPNPKAAATLVRVLHRLAGIGGDLADLDRAAREFDQNLNRRMAARQPPPARQTGAPDVGGDLPSAESAIREVERMLGLGPDEGAEKPPR
jgi:hypothetical protein